MKADHNSISALTLSSQKTTDTDEFRFLMNKVQKTYMTRNGALRVLEDITLSIEEHEFICIMGSTGCGKTTLMRLMSGIEACDRGSDFYFYNVDASHRIPKSLLSHVGVVFQGDNLMEWRSVYDNVRLPLEVFGLKRNPDYADNVMKALELVGLQDYKSCYPKELSGGMRQRVVIAIALSCNPDLLICDEPTTALDVTIQAKIIELIRRIQKERGISVIYITHDLGVVAKVADYIHVMYAGKIVEKGTINEVFYDPRHPYTWGLLSAMPDLDTADERLYTIPGSPPNLLHEKCGDAFAPRNRYALEVDYKAEPPMFRITDTHYAATWLLDERAPKVEMPKELRERLDRMKKEAKNNGSEL